jgi:GDP-4-dehydro-6-deoxy-D-mannose reductase
MKFYKISLPISVFLNLRGVCAAYLKLLRLLGLALTDRISKIATGYPRRISDALLTMLQHSNETIKIEQDLERLGPYDILIAVGGFNHMLVGVDWQLKYLLDDRLGSLLVVWREQLAK